jgi:solute carrier family 25 phosphate transporter 23/24/25/41
MPAREYGSQLRAMLSFYDSVTHVTPEGDSLVSEETLEGLGTDGKSRSLLHSLFGSMYRVAFPFGHTTSPPQAPPPTQSKTGGAASSELESPPALGRDMNAGGEALRASVDLVETEQQSRERQTQPIEHDTVAETDSDGTLEDGSQLSTAGAVQVKKIFKLTDYFPHPGYFLAGAIAGGVSRTATAPLDRLKVYLLVNTNKPTEAAVAALKKAQPVGVVKNAVRPIGNAIRDLFQSGGLRGFFAGESRYNSKQGVAGLLSPLKICIAHTFTR